MRPQGLFRGAARSLFVTPWFAAATGFVIAAGLWVYSPHTVLRFPNSEPGVSVCQSTGCGQDSNPHLTVVAPGVQIHGGKAKKTSHPAKAAVDRGSTAADGLVFEFTVLWQRHHGFGATITVTGHKVPDSWRLSFDLPGTQIDDVMGVTWTPNSDGNGGTASQASWQSGESGGGNSSDGSGAFGGGSGDGGDGGLGADVAQSGTDKLPVIRFLVTGNGPANAPVHCNFDGASCTFG